MIKFFVTLAATCGIIIGITSWAINHAYLGELPTFFYQSLVFLALTTGIIYSYLYRVDKPDFFVQLYLLMMTIKLLAYGGYAYFMITMDSANATSNVVFFMITYFLFTALEVAFLYKQIRNNLPK